MAMTRETAHETAIGAAEKWPEIMTRLEVAAMTRQAESTLRYWATVGKGPKFFKVGGRRVLYKQSDVLNWLDQYYANAS
jgi:predicted DNA-binding transcriptional regulator AlpA